MWRNIWDPRNGQHRCRCLNLDYSYETFSQTIDCPSHCWEVKQQIIEMTLKGSEVKNIARVLHMNTAIAIKKLKKPCNYKLSRWYCIYGWGSYKRHLPIKLHEVGKRKKLREERKHLRLRTRIKQLVRQIICFSRVRVDDVLVIDIFMNCYELGLSIYE